MLVFKRSEAAKKKMDETWNKGCQPCWCCGKKVNPETVKRLRIDYADNAALTLDEAKTRYPGWEEHEDNSQMYEEPIGNDCLRNHPELRPYLIPGYGGAR